MPGLYLEPAGLLYGPVANDAVALGVALPLAGSGIAFCAVRLWEGQPGNIKHAVVRTPTVQAIGDPRIKELLERIIAGRQPIAGVSMDATRIMGVVNVTPDSFSDGGDYADAGAAAARAMEIVAEGADLIDIGGESTRPGAEPTPAAEELRRILPVLEKMAPFPIPVSVDTRKPEVMRAAAGAGAALINDISALTFAEDSACTAAGLKKPVILMHAQGDPETMQRDPFYKDVVVEVYDFLEARIDAALAAGIPRAMIVADPGIGFGKTLAHNLALLQSISMFHGLGVPILTGTSRKGFIGTITGSGKPKERQAGSVAAGLDAASQGVQIIRVHDVAAMREALSVVQSIRAGRNVATERN